MNFLNSIKSDEFYTMPKDIVNLIDCFPVIREKTWILPFNDENSAFKLYALENNISHLVIGWDLIKSDSLDFDLVDPNCIIISNPPFSIFSEICRDIDLLGLNACLLGCSYFDSLKDRSHWPLRYGFQKITSSFETYFTVPDSSLFEKKYFLSDGSCVVKKGRLCWWSNCDYLKKEA